MYVCTNNIMYFFRKPMSHIHTILKRLNLNCSLFTNADIYLLQYKLFVSVLIMYCVVFFKICTIHFTSLITGKCVRRTPPPCILGPWPSWRLYTLCSMLYPNYKRPGVTTRIILPWFANSSTSS